MSNVMTISKRTVSGLEEVLRTLLLDAESKVPADRLRIVGAVADGAIMESGSNANGYWIRLTDGMQMCWHTVFALSQNILPDYTVYDTTLWTPPASFLGDYAVEILNCSAKDASGYQIFLGRATQGDWDIVYNTGNRPAAHVPGTAVRTAGGENINSYSVRLFAIGRWKA